MKIYHFVVWHKVANVEFGPHCHHWPSSYFYHADNDLSASSLSWIASQIVLAERVIMFEQVEFTHVVVFEKVIGQVYDADTVTHTLLVLAEQQGQGWNGVRGFRVGQWLDEYFYLRWARNTIEGRAVEGAVAGCVGADDIVRRFAVGRRTWRIVVNSTSPLFRSLFRRYAQILASMPELKHEIEIDRLGYYSRNMETTSGMMFRAVSDHQRLRMQHRKRSKNAIWLYALLSFATNQMLDDLRLYYTGMNTFDHYWGDGHLPDFSANVKLFLQVAAIWQPLCEVFGYTIENDVYRTPIEWLEFDGMPSQPATGSLKLRVAHAQVHTCLIKLFHCHQWLCYWYNDLSGVTLDRQGYHHWKGGVTTGGVTKAEEMFNDWESWTATIFEVVDCINVLNSIVMDAEPRRSGKTAPNTSRPAIPVAPRPAVSYPSTVRATAFHEVFPMPAEPSFFTPEQPTNIASIAIPEAVEEIPEAEFQWVDTSDDDDEFGMLEIIKATLRKLETIRRWIGKIRQQMPWYKGIPIEKIAPAQDDADNPFTGAPIERGKDNITEWGT